MHRISQVDYREQRARLLNFPAALARARACERKAAGTRADQSVSSHAPLSSLHTSVGGRAGVGAEYLGGLKQRLVLASRRARKGPIKNDGDDSDGGSGGALPMHDGTRPRKAIKDSAGQLASQRSIDDDALAPNSVAPRRRKIQGIRESVTYESRVSFNIHRGRLLSRSISREGRIFRGCIRAIDNFAFIGYPRRIVLSSRGTLFSSSRSQSLKSPTIGMRSWMFSISRHTRTHTNTLSSRWLVS